MASTRTVNYSVRVGKHVERQMILEVLQRLDRLPPRLSAYRYVGFGGIFFTDFLLIHRHLGITDMVSIEKSQTDRFAFNRPLSCIDLRFGASTQVLPRVLGELRPSRTPAVLWLDYDGPVSTAVTADAVLVAAEVQPMSVLLVTVNCEPLQDINARVHTLAAQLGDQMPPQITSGAQLGGWKLAEWAHRLVSGAVAEALVDRNLALPPAERVHYRQLFHFHYSDGARMLTVGGIFHLPDQVALLDEAFSGLGQLRASGDAALALDVPVLTAREVRHLLEQLPPGASPTSVAASPGLPPADAQKFVDMYRHYPLYAEVGPQ